MFSESEIDLRVNIELTISTLLSHVFPPCWREYLQQLTWKGQEGYNFVNQCLLTAPKAFDIRRPA